MQHTMFSIHTTIKAFLLLTFILVGYAVYIPETIPENVQITLPEYESYGMYGNQDMNGGYSYNDYGLQSLGGYGGYGGYGEYGSS